MRALINDVHILFAAEVGDTLLASRLIHLFLFFYPYPVLSLKSAAQSSDFSVESVFFLRLVMALLVYMLCYQNYT